MTVGRKHLSKIMDSPTATKKEYSTGFIHPLLHKNTSTSDKLKYTTTFMGDEFFLSDHVVKGKPILLGVAYLEMVRAAIEKSEIISEKSKPRFQLRNLIWARPIVVDKEPLKVNISLKQEKNGDVSYSIYSESENEIVEYCQGIAKSSMTGDMEPLDLDTLREQCNKRSMSSGQCYDIFQLMGVEYGPNLRGIEEIFIGKDQILTKLSLPPAIQDTQDQYFLHPCIMDSALQGSVAFLLGSNNIRSALPFALRNLIIIRTWIKRTIIRNISGFKRALQRFMEPLCLWTLL